MPRKVADLKQHNCLSFLPGSFRSSWPLRNGAEVSSHELKGNFGSNSAELLRSIAVAGVGVVRLSDMQVENDIRGGRLVRVLESAGTDAEEPLYVVYASRRNQSARMRAFLAFIDERFCVVSGADAATL